jgi:hypothetical protein
VSRVVSGSCGRLLLHGQTGEMAEPAVRSTADLVCQGRANADGLYAVGRFSDPIAREPLDQADQLIVDLVRADTGITDADGHLPETAFNPGPRVDRRRMVGSAAGSWGGVERVETSLGTASSSA